MSYHHHIAIAGAGLAGAVLARELAETGNYKIIIFEEKNHVAGHCHTSRDEETGVLVHEFGPHIFNTNREDIWEYVNKWGRFEPYINRVKAVTEKGVFSFPVNLHTINQLFNKKLAPREAVDYISSLRESTLKKSDNFEDEARRDLGHEIYKTFLAGYAKKIWGVSPKHLSASLLGPIPIRFNYNENYFDKRYQGIPVSGHTEIVKRILDHPSIELRLGQRIEPVRKREFDHLFWSGPIDGFFGYRLGRLPYRALMYERFIDHGDYQGCAIMNYCEDTVSHTRILEHKHLAPWEVHEKTVCFKEYAKDCEGSDTPAYPVKTKENRELFKQYLEMADQEDKITFIGRLGTFRYMNMDDVIYESLELAQRCINSEISSWPRISY